MPIIVSDEFHTILNRHDVEDQPLKPFDLGTDLWRVMLKRQDSASADELQGMQAECWPFLLRLDLTERGENPWQSCFRPMSVATSPDGTSVANPPMTTATGDHVAHWIARARSAKHPVMKARYADVAWELGRLITGAKKDLSIAHLAFAAYIDSTRDGAGDLLDRFQHGGRALDLAAQTGDQARLAQARSTLMDLHRSHKEDDTGIWWCRTYDHFVRQKKAGATADELRELVQDMEVALARNAARGGPSTPDLAVAEAVAKRLLDHFTRSNRRDDFKRIQHTMGQAYEAHALQGDAAFAAAWLQNSVKAYQDAGMGEEAARVRVLMEAKIAESHSLMARFETRQHMSEPDYQAFINLILDDSSWVTLANIVNRFLPSFEHVQTSMQDLARHAPLMARISHTIMAPNHVAGRIGSIDDDLPGRTLAHHVQVLQIEEQFLKWAMDAAFKSHAYEVAHFVNISNKTGLFDAGGTELLADGFAAWLAGDYRKAVHILIPQIECALRGMVGAMGKPVTKPYKPVPGVSVAIGMGDILYEPDIIEGLGERGKDLQLHLQALYADPRGYNLRNQCAHGLLNPQAMHEGTVLWMVHTLMTLGIWPLTPPGKASEAEELASL